jgi:hypothetical protein
MLLECQLQLSRNLEEFPGISSGKCPLAVAVLSGPVSDDLGGLQCWVR